jgi:GNAT superfamily N-acetyltransferase
MTTIQIVPVQSALQKQQFVELPNRLHSHDSKFVPALAWDESRLLGFTPGHPYPEENEVQAWLAIRGDRPVGRIATFCARNSASTNSNVGNFGFFAAEDDLAVTQALMQTAATWNQHRGVEIIRGPFSPSINYGVGLLHDGFEHEPSFQIPYNLPYYASLLEGVGMHAVQELYALELGRTILPSVTQRLERVAQRLTQRYFVNFRQLNPRKMRQELNLFLSIAEGSLQQHWGFVPLSQRERATLIEDMRWIVQPHMLHFAEIDGKAVGAALALPDLAPCVRSIGGKLFPWGWLKMWWAKHHAARYRVVATNVLPEYSRLGLAPALIGRIFRKIQNTNAQSVEFSWIAQSNPLSFGTIENGGARRTKTLRVYEASCEELLTERSGRRSGGSESADQNSYELLTH